MSGSNKEVDDEPIDEQTIIRNDNDADREQAQHEIQERILDQLLILNQYMQYITGEIILDAD